MRNDTSIKDASHAIEAIKLLATGNKRQAARVTMAKAVCARPAYALYDEAGFVEWDKYLVAGCPAVWGAA